MKRKTIPALALLSMSSMMAMPAAQAAEVSVSGDIGVASQYVWRGAVQKGTTAVQGDVGVAVDGFSASAWFSNSYAATVPQYAGKEVIEFDYTADYSFNVGDLGVSLGGIYYTYMYDSPSNFVEGYVGLSYDTVLAPSLSVYYVANGSRSQYYRAGDIWVDFGLGGSVAGFDLSATASYAKWAGNPLARSTAIGAAVDVYKDGVSLVQLGASKDIEAGSVTVTPSIGLSIPVIKKSTDGERYIYGVAVKPEFIASVNIAY